MSAPHPSADGATDAEIAAAVAALLAVASGDPVDAPAGDRTPEVSTWRRATGPLSGAWPDRGWRTPTRPRTWS